MPSGGPAVTVVDGRGVAKSWGRHQVFANIDVTVPPGITGLLGSNGAGKTTLIGMVLGLHRPDGGQLRVLGRDPSTAGPEIRARIGYSPEHHRLPADVRAHDLVRHIALLHGLPKREATTRASDALWLVGLGEERVRPIGTMSTGQRQRVKLAQAIAHDPELVVLDEPTDGLDPLQRDAMLELIRRCGSEFGMSILLSSHQLEEVERICDAAVIIGDGRVIANGLIDELRGGDAGVEIELDGAVEPVAVALGRAGLTVHVDGRRVLVDGPVDDDAYDTIRDVIADRQAPLHRLRLRRATLEEVYLRAGDEGTA